MPTLAQLRQGVYQRLAEPVGGNVFAVADALTNTLYATSDVVVNGYLNEAANHFTRVAVPLPASGTFDGAIGQKVFALSSFNIGTGYGDLWAVHSLYLDSVRVRSASAAAARLNSLSAMQAWSQTGEGALSLKNALTAIQSVEADGYAVPASMDSDGAEPLWCPDALTPALMYYACWQICDQLAAASGGNANETIAEKSGLWHGRYMTAVAEQQERLRAQDPNGFNLFFSMGGK